MIVASVATLWSLLAVTSAQAPARGGKMDRQCFGISPRDCMGMRMQKYFFDEVKGKCVYKAGCMYTGFISLQQCNKECTCRQAPSEGSQVGASPMANCEQEIMRWMYVGEACVQQPYTGCGGNGNNFRTQSECTNTCNPREIESVMGMDVPKFGDYHLPLYGHGAAHPGMPAGGHHQSGFGHGPPPPRRNSPGRQKPPRGRGPPMGHGSWGQGPPPPRWGRPGKRGPPGRRGPPPPRRGNRRGGPPPPMPGNGRNGPPSQRGPPPPPRKQPQRNFDQPLTTPINLPPITTAQTWNDPFSWLFF